jgi:hypothetical protein
MASRLPRSRKPSDQLRRRNAPESWTVLPANGVSAAAPKWPFGKASKDELELWRRLWALPIAAWWREQRIEPFVVSRYVSLALSTPSHSAVAKLESDLGLTPAALLRLRLVVEEPELEESVAADPYAHLKVAK